MKQALRVDMDKQTLIETLQLEPHVEGGYFRCTYTSPKTITITRREVNRQELQYQRPIMTSIYYLLMSDHPIDHFHCNQSNIMHYFYLGLPVRYLVITPDGTLQETLLGPTPCEGHKQQLLVPGGCWKACELLYKSEHSGIGRVDPATVHTGGRFSPCDYALISEAVAPGFDYIDMKLATAVEMQSAYSNYWERIKHLIKEEQ